MRWSESSPFRQDNLVRWFDSNMCCPAPVLSATKANITLWSQYVTEWEQQYVLIERSRYLNDCQYGNPLAIGWKLLPSIYIIRTIHIQKSAVPYYHDAQTPTYCKATFDTCWKTFRLDRGVTPLELYQWWGKKNIFHGTSADKIYSSKKKIPYVKMEGSLCTKIFRIATST